MIQDYATAWVPLRLAQPGSISQQPGAKLTADNSQLTARREYGVTFIQAGYVQRRDGQRSNWRIPIDTLRAAVPLLEGKPVFVDHAEVWDMPSLRNLAAVTFGPTWNIENISIDGGIRLYDRPDLAWLGALLDQIVEDQAAGREVPDIGLSLSFFGRHELVPRPASVPGAEEEYERVTSEITHVESVDLVFGPGANGRVREILSMVGQPQGLPVQVKGVMPQEEKNMESEKVVQEERQEEARPADTGPTDARPTTGVAELERQLSQAVAHLDRLAQLMADHFEPKAVQGMGVAPRSRHGDAGATVPRVHGMLDTRDQIERAYEQLMGLPVSEPVYRLSGIRELYLLLTGDREFRGQINLDLVPYHLAYSSAGANADTTTMAELTRNVMAKALVQQLDLLQEYQWWRRIARIDNFNSLQQVSWVRYGGIGYSSGTGLPTVAEKGEYQQLYWEDARTTADWVKKGGYLPLSLEMIDRDDLQGWRDVPRQLAVAEAVTISSVVSALFTDNSGVGPALGDSVGDGYAFNTTRGNLITQPLDQTNWNTAVETMYKLTQLMNASVTETRRIAARPRYVLVPIELEDDAIAAVGSEVKSGTYGDRVPTRRLLPEENVITVPHWTDPGSWAALADPALVPFVGVAFRFGENPEIFMPGPENHILWLHDVLPIKVRWFFAVGVIDWRGAIKSNA